MSELTDLNAALDQLSQAAGRLCVRIAERLQPFAAAINQVAETPEFRQFAAELRASRNNRDNRRAALIAGMYGADEEVV